MGYTKRDLSAFSVNEITSQLKRIKDWKKENPVLQCPFLTSKGK